MFPNTCILKSSLVMIGTRSPRCLISASLNGILNNSAQGKTWRSVVQEFASTDRSNNNFLAKNISREQFFFAQVWLCQWSRPDIYSTVKLPSLVIHQKAGFNTRYAANLNKPMYHDSVKGR